MRSGEPIADLVLGIKPRKKDDAVDVLPAISEAGLQRQLLSHRNEAHDFVRSVLLHIRREPKRHGGCEVPESNIGQKRSLRKIDAEDHVKHGAGRIDFESTNDARLKTGYLVPERS